MQILKNVGLTIKQKVEENNKTYLIKVESNLKLI